MKRNQGKDAFLAVWLVFAAALTTAVICTDKLELHRSMHPAYSAASDLFFAAITHVGDGLVPTVLALLILLFRDIRSFLMMGLSCAVSAVLVQILKRVFAEDRPFMFREQLGDLHWVPGVDLHHHLSFPSGHSTAAWAMCFSLAILVGGRAAGFAFAVLAVLIAYSRVYLSQHFTEDILAGSAIGVATAWVVHHWLYGEVMMARSWPRHRIFAQRNQ